MFGRFPLYTDEDVDGDLIELLRRRGWDLVRAVERYPQGTQDPVHFEQAAKEGRVLITNDQPSLDTAHRWLGEGRAFKGVLTWPKKHHARMTIGEIDANSNCERQVESNAGRTETDDQVDSRARESR